MGIPRILFGTLLIWIIIISHYARMARFLSLGLKNTVELCLIVHVNSQISKPFIIHLMHKEIRFLKDHIMLSIDIYSIVLNVITMKLRKIWNWSKESSFVFIGFLYGGRLWDGKSTVSVLVNAAQDPVGSTSCSSFNAFMYRNSENIQ